MESETSQAAEKNYLYGILQLIDFFNFWSLPRPPEIGRKDLSIINISSNRKLSFRDNKEVKVSMVA